VANHPVGIHQVAHDEGADPQRRVRRQLRAARRIETLHGVREAGVAFLDQIHEITPVPPAELARDLDDESQVAQHQPFGIAPVTAVDVAFREGLLLRRGHRRGAGEQSAVVVVEHHRRTSAVGVSPCR
jgi:hypothetical protein